MGIVITMETQEKIEQMLKHIDPAGLNYQEWVEVGMAIKAEGLPCDVWEDWSAPDPRHKPDDCYKRWAGFGGQGVTGATITHLAKLGGWMPAPKPSADPERVIGFDDDIVLDHLQTINSSTPLCSDPAKQAIEYLRHAFKSGELVNVVTAAKWDDDRQKWFPANAGFSQERDSIIKRLEQGLDGFAGDRNREAGVWIRANPVDGKGVRNANIKSFRHVLVESDEMDLDKQIEIYKRLELPITCLTLSAGKSVHAMVKIEAEDEKQYAERVKKVFQMCEEQGLIIDRQNRNPARLTRFAGFERGDKEQSLLAVEIGSKSYEEWAETFVLDELPEYESLADIFKNPPELPPETIRGVLRQGEKLVLTGPSKAGKSFALIELAVALATGGYWLGTMKCTTQRVVYINFELPKANAAARLMDVWKEVRNKNISGTENLQIWNLRGTTVTAKSMVDSIIKRHKSMSNPPGFYIIDPIYKINAGDENAAKDINDLLREFDRLCTETNANLVYAHHHAKGSQFGKRALDRGSGSGVIGRDADASIDLDFLFVPDKIKVEKAKYYSDDSWKKATGLRVEMTLRNFETKPPFNVWFKYPVHIWDNSEEFQKLRGDGEKTSLDKAEDGKKRKKESTDDEIKSEINRQIDEQGFAQIGVVEENVSPSRGTINRFLKENSEFQKDGNGKITRVSKTENPVSDTRAN